MSLSEIAFLLFLVVDPFGNLPFVLAILAGLSTKAYVLAVTREVLLAFAVLVVFALFGDRILEFLNISQFALNIAGGVILFLISLKMIFQTSSAIFGGQYKDNPFLVPIAVPSIAGPSAMTTVIVLRTREQIPLDAMLGALLLVSLLTLGTLLLGRVLSAYLGLRGINALEKFMGLLLNLIAVNMIMNGVRDFLREGC